MFFKINEETQEIEESNHVSGLGFDLSEVSKDEYTFPVCGWYYFENREQAEIFFKINP